MKTYLIILTLSILFILIGSSAKVINGDNDLTFLMVAGAAGFLSSVFKIALLLILKRTRQNKFK